MSNRRLHLYRLNEAGERERWAFVVDERQTIVEEYHDPVPRAGIPSASPHHEAASHQAILYRIHAAPSPEAEALVTEFQEKLSRMLGSGECKDGTGPCQRNALVRQYAEKLRQLS